jgi:hypothetical protein
MFHVLDVPKVIRFLNEKTNRDARPSLSFVNELTEDLCKTKGLEPLNPTEKSNVRNRLRQLTLKMDSILEEHKDLFERI